MKIYAYMQLTDPPVYPLFEGDIRLVHPEIDPDVTGDQFPCPPDFAPVYCTPMPELGDRQYAVNTSNVCIDGTWYQEWTVKTYTQAQIEIIAAQRNQPRGSMGGFPFPASSNSIPITRI